MTINPVLAQIETKAQVTGTSRQEQVGRWLSEAEGAESSAKGPTRTWQTRWVSAALAIGGLVALIFAFVS